MGETISVYASNADIDPSGESLVVTLEEVDINQVLQEFSTPEILSALDFDTLKEYVVDHSNE